MSTQTTWLCQWREAFDDDDSLSFIVTEDDDYVKAVEHFNQYIVDNYELEQAPEGEDPNWYLITVLQMPEGFDPHTVRWH